MRSHRVTSHGIPEIFLTSSLTGSASSSLTSPPSSLPSGAVFTSDPSTEHHLSSSPLLRDPYEAKVGQSWLKDQALFSPLQPLSSSTHPPHIARIAPTGVTSGCLDHPRSRYGSVRPPPGAQGQDPRILQRSPPPPPGCLPRGEVGLPGGGRTPQRDA